MRFFLQDNYSEYFNENERKTSAAEFFWHSLWPCKICAQPQVIFFRILLKQIHWRTHLVQCFFKPFYTINRKIATLLIFQMAFINVFLFFFFFVNALLFLDYIFELYLIEQIIIVSCAMPIHIVFSSLFIKNFEFIQHRNVLDNSVSWIFI